MMFRLFDFFLALMGLLLLLPVLLIVTVIGYFDTGSPIFRQTRVGKNQQPFTLIKFRTMAPDTASVATHLASASSVTRIALLFR